MSDDLILTDVAEGVLTVTLNRPDKLNAFTWDMVDRLVAILKGAERDEAVHVIVLKGTGRAFSTGFDLADSAVAAPVTDGPQQETFTFQRAAAAWRSVWQTRKPIIAAVHGFCLAAGMEMILHADFAICAEDAVFGYPPVRASGLPDTHMFLYQIGPQWTRRLLMTGERIDGVTAEKIGLVLKAVPADRLDAEVAALAASVRGVPQPILEGVKAVVNQGIDLMGYTALQRENWAQSAMARSMPEIKEFDRIAREQGLKAALAWRDASGKE